MQQALNLAIAMLALAGVALVSMTEAVFIAASKAAAGAVGEEDGGGASLAQLCARPVRSLPGLIACHAAITIAGVTFLCSALPDSANMMFVANVYAVAQVLLCEVIPKAYGMVHAERLARRLVPVMRTTVVLFLPVTTACEWLARGMGLAEIAGTGSR